MKKFISQSMVAAALIATSIFSVQATASGATKINGAGATFPYPVYAKWANAYHKESGVQLNYQSIGSGGGIKQIKARTVNFGASDAPLKPAELNKFGLIQWPQIMGGVVPVVNIKGIAAGKLKLDGKLLAEIYLGSITKWNAPQIKALNPGLSLPAETITVVHRADASGTTFIFTNYLTKVSNTWKKEVGNAKSVAWPAGVGGKGNEGVANYVGRIDGSIGYVEYAYAVQNKLSYTLLKNQSGHFVAPTSKNFAAAAANANWSKAPGYYLILTNQPGARSWPITGASFILMYKKQANPDIARAVIKFYDWSYHKGKKMANNLHYVPMPNKVISMIEKTWIKNIRTTNGKAIWSAKMNIR